jgi:hypothetical protein
MALDLRHPHLPHPHLPSTTTSPADARLLADGRSHTRETVLAWAALGLGALAFLIGALGGVWAGVVVGVAGVAVAVVAQMLSASTAERWLIIPGWVLSALGIALSLFNR